LSIWNDQSDIMSVRDAGWIQIFVDNGQQSFDQTICAFRIGEDRRVLLPVGVNLDGFSLSHVVEPFTFETQETVNRFLPPYQPLYTIHPDKPLTMGAFGMPEIYAEAKKAQEVALRDSKQVILEVWDEWAKLTGRSYQPIESYRMEDAEIAILAAGAICEVTEEAIDEMRRQGKRVGLLRLRLWRPFPFDELRQAVAGVKSILVIDRALSFGGPGGPIFSEIRSALYDRPKAPDVMGFIAGLGGRDVPPEHIMEMVEIGTAKRGKKKREDFYMIGIRE
jgi:pyruvate ferredoxin oxidoreductase alpha subunit